MPRLLLQSYSAGLQCVAADSLGGVSSFQVETQRRVKTLRVSPILLFFNQKNNSFPESLFHLHLPGELGLAARESG